MRRIVIIGTFCTVTANRGGAGITFNEVGCISGIIFSPRSGTHFIFFSRSTIRIIERTTFRFVTTR